MSKGIFYCCTAPSDTLHEDLSTLYCCQYKFAVKSLLCNIQYFYILDSGVFLNNTQKMHCFVSTTTMVTRTLRNVTLYLPGLSC